MENIVCNRQYEPLPMRLCNHLPEVLVSELSALDGTEELLLSGERCSFAKIDGRYLPLRTRLSATALQSIFLSFCDGSVYAHAETLREGYLSLGGGLRVGVTGRAVIENGRVSGVYDIRSLIVRIPHAVFPDVSAVLSLMAACDFCRGVLVYAPVGGGKTTLLRSLALQLASGAEGRHVVVVDTRDELAYGLGSPSLCLDILSGYPKAYGIEVATRVLGAQIIVCDEIGDEREADAILGVQNGGAALIASAHASSLGELLGRPMMARLHGANMFCGYVCPARGHAPVLTAAEAAHAGL